MLTIKKVKLILAVASLLPVMAGTNELKAVTVGAAVESCSPTNMVGTAQTNGMAGANRVSGLVDLEFSNYHLTPRGLNLQDRGVVFQPYVCLDWTIYQPGQATNQIIDKADITTAMFNDFDSARSGVDPGSWNELDFIVGPNVSLWDNWRLESPFISFKSETGSYPTCLAWDPRLTYHDHWFANFSVNPYVEFFDELQNKVTFVLVQAKSESSYYGVIGADPTYETPALPLIFDLPTYVLIPGQDFYQRANGAGGGTDLGMFATSLKVTLPLEFMGFGAVRWNIHAAVQYDYLNNPGMLDGNEFAGAGLNRERSFLVFHGGITVCF